MTTTKANDGNWTGALGTAVLTATQIYDRWGAQAVKEYDPATNCFTYRKWQELGFQVKKGEKSLHSYTWVTLTDQDETTGAERDVKKYPKTVYLFYKNQVEPKAK